MIQALEKFLSAIHAPAWVLPAVILIGSARLVLKPFNARLQGKLTELMLEAAASADPSAQRDWEWVLHQRWYRILNFSLDLALSLKLPVLADFLRANARAPVALAEMTTDDTDKNRMGKTAEQEGAEEAENKTTKGQI